MRLLVTGGTGFLGQVVVRSALASGLEVAVLSRGGDPGVTPQGTWIRGSLESPDWSAIKKWSPEACVHAAWIATPGVYLDSPENERLAEDSLQFLRQLAELGLRRAVVLGTCIEYAMTGRPFIEDSTPLEPTSPYARSKHLLHLRLRPILSDRECSLAWGRIFYPYGPGEHPARLMSSLVRRFRAGESIRLKTPDSIKDYIHADDVARALLHLVHCDFDGAVNIGTGVGTRIADIAHQIALLLGRPGLIEQESGEHDPFDRVVADNSRLKSLGWNSEVSLESGLEGMVDRISK